MPYDENMVAAVLAEMEARLEKSSDHDLDEPEGDDLDAGTHTGEKLSDEADKDGGAGGFKKKSPQPVKKGKRADEEDEEKEKPDDEDEENEMKSLKGAADAEIQNKIEVSEFLKSFHDSLSEVLDSVSEVVQKSASLYDERTKSIETQIADLQEYQAKMGVVLKAMCEHLGMLGNQPARDPKSVAKAGGADGKPVERNFADPRAVLEASAEKSAVFPGLSDNPLIAKSQLVETLVTLVKSGDKTVDVSDVINLESSGHMRPEIVPIVQKAFVAKSAA